MSVTLTEEQFDAFVSLARKGAADTEKLRHIDAFIRDVEKTNNLVRFRLQIMWQEAASELPASAVFPGVWPPELKALLEQRDRPIAKSDVLALLSRRANKPINIYVTRDIAGELGWQKLEDFFT